MPALKGNLNTVDLANIFQMLSMNQCEGTLYIFDSTSRKAIWFGKDGVSMLSKGRARSDALGRILVRMDRVMPAQLQAALAKQVQNGRLLGQILVDDAACTRDDVEECLEIQIREEVCRLFLWKDAEFEFVDGEPNEEFRKEGVQRLAFSVNGIIVEAAKRVDEWEWIQTVVPEMGEIYAYTGSNVDLQDAVFSEPFSGKVLAVVDGKRSIDEMIEASCVNRFEVCKILAILVEAGAVRKLSADELRAAADAATAAGDGAAAAKFLSRLVAQTGETPELHRRLGEAYEWMHEVEKASRHYGVYAEVKATAGAKKEAFEIYLRIARFLPTDLAAQDRMIELFAESPEGLEANAKEVVERGKRLAEVYIELKRGSRAVAALRRVASLGPDDPDLRERLIAVYLASGMNAEAIAEYEALADAALAARDYENAEKLCRRILSIDRGRTDVAARVAQVVAKRRMLARGIRGLFVAVAAVAFASFATWQGVAFYKSKKAEHALRENESQDALHTVAASISPVVSELDALNSELAQQREGDAGKLAAALRERLPRIEAVQKHVTQESGAVAELCSRCQGYSSEEDAQSLAAELASKSDTLRRRVGEIRRLARDASELCFDRADQMIESLESTRGVLEQLEEGVKIAEDVDGPAVTEKAKARIELRAHVRAYVSKFDATKSEVERRVAANEIDAAYDLAVAYLVDKDFPPPDLRAAMPVPIRLVSHPSGARVLTKDGADTGLVAGPDCVAKISVLTGAAFELELPGFDRAVVSVPAVKEVDGSVLRERVRRTYDVVLEKSAAWRRGASDGKALVAAPFASAKYVVVPSSRACDVLDIATGRLVSTLSLQAQLGLRAGGAVVAGDPDDVVVLPTADGALAFFDAATGKSRGVWSESHGAVTFDLAQSGGDVIAADDRGGLYCVNVAKRAKKWGGQALLENGEPTYFAAAPVVAGGGVFVGCEDGTVRVLDLADGRVVTLLAKPAADAGRVTAPVAADGGFAYVVSRCGAKSSRVTKWNVATGRSAWSVLVGGECKSSPAVRGGEAILVTTTGEVVGLDVVDGRRTRSFSLDRSVKVLGEATLDGDALYVGCDDGVLHAVDLSGRELSALWKFVARTPAGKPVAITTRCVVAGGRILFGAADDAVRALDRTR